MLGSLDGREITYKRDPFLNGFSMNISCISGGQAVNAVPDECSFTVDCRFVPGQDYNEVINVIRGKIAEMSAADPDLDAEVEIISRCTNAVRFPADAELVEVLSQSIREATGHVIGENFANGSDKAGRWYYRTDLINTSKQIIIIS